MILRRWAGAVAPVLFLPYIPEAAGPLSFSAATASLRGERLAWLIAGKPVLNSGIIPRIRQCVLFRHHVPPRDRAATPSFYHQPEASEKGTQHVSEKNVAFMALLCVYAVLGADKSGEGLTSFQVPLFSGGYIQAVYLFCL